MLWDGQSKERAEECFGYGLEDVLGGSADGIYAVGKL